MGRNLPSGQSSPGQVRRGGPARLHPHLADPRRRRGQVRLSYHHQHLRARIGRRKGRQGLFAHRPPGHGALFRRPDIHRILFLQTAEEFGRLFQGRTEDPVVGGRPQPLRHQPQRHHLHVHSRQVLRHRLELHPFQFGNRADLPGDHLPVHPLFQEAEHFHRV